MLIYRLFVHPLRAIPGPTLAKATKFWHSIKLSDPQNQKLLETLHEQYGDIVRIGPNEVFVFRADGVPAVHGPGSRCIKAPWYDMFQKDRSIHATRKPPLHQARRKIWDQGFGIKARRSYQERVATHVDQLGTNIGKRTRKLVLGNASSFCVDKWNVRMFTPVRFYVCTNHFLPHRDYLPIYSYIRLRVCRFYIES
ncbi:hypothetical protein CC86DRAFT_407152 [Ophiobolus disseminans]|uniref:Cytochrome P450 n=1 Tax=Ophiobolus disseminans TaxID=1469910 RepID=A0A6A6ZZP4_9PLEO|nr:hypothetical protein CC86DRAFT_407152 [Ophiobolus disseminans]